MEVVYGNVSLHAVTYSYCFLIVQCYQTSLFTMFIYKHDSDT